MAIRTRSAWSGRHPGARTAFTACLAPGESFPRQTCSPWKWTSTLSSIASSPISSFPRSMDRRTLPPALAKQPKFCAASANGADSAISWKSYRWMSETTWLENVLSQQPPRWLPAGLASFNDVLVSALEEVAKQAPADMNSWKWGRENSTTIQNLILGKIPMLRRWTGPGEQPQSGSVYTVKAAGRDYGPSERFTADLSNLDTSTLNLVTGNAGNFLSPYYMDQWEAWYTGYTFVLPFTTSAVEKSAAHRLMLQPK